MYMLRNRVTSCGTRNREGSFSELGVGSGNREGVVAAGGGT